MRRQPDSRSWRGVWSGLAFFFLATLAAAEPVIVADPELSAAATALLTQARFDEVHALAGAPAPADPRPHRPCHAFYDHVLAGIRSNAARAPIYERLSAGASRPIIRRLTLFQRLFLPLAWLVDRRAHRFQRRGIPIVAGDLMPVAGLPDPTTPPRWRNRLDPAAARQLAADLKAYRRDFWASVRAADFAGAAELSYRVLRQVERLEATAGCHLAMVKHFLESLGLGALHAIRYVEMSQGEVIPLAKAFLAVQLLPFDQTLPLDLEAQALHARGVGIVVNDVPAIPFAAEWEAAHPHRPR